VVLGVGDAGSRCPWGQIEVGLVNLHGLEATLWVKDVSSVHERKIVYTVYVKIYTALLKQLVSVM